MTGVERTPLTVAVTGATGFLGQKVIAALASQGCHLRLLARREPLGLAAIAGTQPDIVLGSLDDRAALGRLVQGVDVVLHVAGAIKAIDDAAYLRVNRDGTRALAEQVAAYAPNAHFILVSSLAARHPELSGYAASKRAGEQAVVDVLGLQRVSIVRPPAIYGPGDRETMIFFELASRKLVPLPGKPGARIALIHVDDAVQSLVARVFGAPTARVQAIADERPDGYSWREILGAASSAVGNTSPRYFSLPGGLVKAVGGGAGAIARIVGKAGMVSAGKIRELLHEDWAVHADELLREKGAEPKHNLPDGFASTAVWYRDAGWL
ncbi:MAG: epimerase [Xanthomonadaceae bacterium]|nr:epimerase [Xanthomonadaceae bacterium]